MDEVKIANSSQTSSHLKSPKIASLCRTLSDSVGHCLTLFEIASPIHRDPLHDFVRSCRTLSGIRIWAQWLDSWESSISTPPPPMALLSWTLRFTIEQAHFPHPQRPNSLSPRVFIPSSCLGIEWSKDSFFLCDSPPQAHLGCWIFILHAYYSWSFAPI
jgi:hypothetical protein